MIASFFSFLIPCMCSCLFVPFNFSIVSEMKCSRCYEASTEENNKCLSSVFYCRILRLASDSWSHVTYLFFTIICLVFRNYSHRNVWVWVCMCVCVYAFCKASFQQIEFTRCISIVHFIQYCRYICLCYEQRQCGKWIENRQMGRERERVKASERKNPINIPYTQLPIKLRRKDACLM